MILNIEQTVTKEYGLLKVEGEVDMYSSPDLRKRVMDLVKKKTQIIMVDLANVRYMDSSGVATLIEGLQSVGKYNGKFVLFGLQDNVREVFELTRLDTIFKIFSNHEEAVAGSVQ